MGGASTTLVRSLLSMMKCANSPFQSTRASMIAVLLFACACSASFEGVVNTPEDHHSQMVHPDVDGLNEMELGQGPVMQGQQPVQVPAAQMQNLPQMMGAGMGLNSQFHYSGSQSAQERQGGFLWSTVHQYLPPAAWHDGWHGHGHGHGHDGRRNDGLPPLCACRSPLPLPSSTLCIRAHLGHGPRHDWAVPAKVLWRLRSQGLAHQGRLQPSTVGLGGRAGAITSNLTAAWDSVAGTVGDTMSLSLRQASQGRALYSPTQLISATVLFHSTSMVVGAGSSTKLVAMAGVVAMTVLTSELTRARTLIVMDRAKC